MNRKIPYLFAGTLGALAIHGHGLASDAAPSTHDGRAIAASYTAAGNSANVTLAGAGGMLQNQPPTTVTDNRSVQRCTITAIQVLANDSDPEGNLPLVLLSVSAGTIGTSWTWNGTTVYYESTITPGAESLTYTVRDSLGATSNGTLNITVSGGVINCA